MLTSEIFTRILGEDIVYCILNGWQGLPEHLQSDLDIVIMPKCLRILEKTLLDTSNGLVVQFHNYAVGCYRFDLAIHEGHKVRFFPLDVATSFRMSSRVWFDAEELLAGRRRWRDFWVAAPEVEFKYLLLKKILKQEIPEYTANRLQELAHLLGCRAAEETVRLLGMSWGRRVLGWIQEGMWDELRGKLPHLKRVAKWHRLKQDPLNLLRYWLPELVRILKRWRHPTGLWVAVLGPDGAGKTTLIEGLSKEMRGPFRQTARFHLMPALLRRQADGGPVTDPHAKPPRSWFGSLLKLAYYWLDYILGYWLKIRPLLVVRPTLILFDRYYDDLFIDPKRYRYGGPIWAVRLLRHLIPRPDIFLVLDVPKERLLERKQEVAPEELERQVRAYREFVVTTPNAVLLDGSKPIEEVVAQARDILLDYLHLRYLKRRSLWFPWAKGEELSWLSSVLGVVFRSGRSTHAFLQLPDGRGYLLPLATTQTFRSSLNLYPAQRAKARVARNALWALTFLGLKAPILPKVNMEDGDTGDCILQTLRKVFGQRDLVFAVSLGTPGPHRKPVIQIMTPSGEALGYAKVGWNEATRALVRNEVRVLQMLQDEDLPFDVPQVLYADYNGERALCVQGAPPAGARTDAQELTAEHIEALCSLACRNLRRRPLEESRFWQCIIERAQQVQNRWWQHFLNRMLESVRQEWIDQEVPFHFAHGDFAPWNALRINNRLYLFDWEYAQEEMPAGYDLFHFLVQTSRLVCKVNPQEIKKAVLDQAKQWLANEFWNCVNIQIADIPKLFQLYILDRISHSLATTGRFSNFQDLLIMSAQFFIARDK